MAVVERFPVLQDVCLLSPVRVCVWIGGRVRFRQIIRLEIIQYYEQASLRSHSISYNSLSCLVYFQIVGKGQLRIAQKNPIEETRRNVMQIFKFLFHVCNTRMTKISQLEKEQKLDNMSGKQQTTLKVQPPYKLSQRH